MVISPHKRKDKADTLVIIEPAYAVVDNQEAVFSVVIITTTFRVR